MHAMLRPDSCSNAALPLSKKTCLVSCYPELSGSSLICADRDPAVRGRGHHDLRAAQGAPPGALRRHAPALGHPGRRHDVQQHRAVCLIPARACPDTDAGKIFLPYEAQLGSPSTAEVPVPSMSDTASKQWQHVKAVRPCSG